ncbi:hypothetical protein GYA28_04420 [Candidatus Roizmanbacteria bacterium]|nr:hypothetical protein [Candidatus Roizmanbacteria bacterium]
MKYVYATKGNPLVDDNELLYALKAKEKKFPHMNGGELTIHGHLGESGVVLSNGHGAIVAAVKHPRHIPKTEVDGVVDFGGCQCDIHIETSLEKPCDHDRVMKDAQMVTYALNQVEDLQHLAENFTGLTAIGSEPEGFYVDAEGDLVKIPGGELQLGMIEETLEAIADPRVFLRERSKQIVSRKKRFSDGFVFDSSVLPTSSPDKVFINDQGDLGPYVKAIQTRLYNDYFSFSDPLAEQLMDKIAANFGYGNHRELRQSLGHMGYWVMAASHASLGLYHRRTGNEAMWIPEQEAIAVSDILNSDLATLAEYLMLSTPVIFGMTPTVEVNGNSYWPRDYRSVLRYLMDTTNPGGFIMSPDKMHQRIIGLVVGGDTHTIDRASYVTEINGRTVPVMHGRVRNRMASSEPKNQTGRVEYTGCSSSPSLYDELARNCFVQVLAIAAYEALSQGQHPVDYFENKFPSLSRWENQKKLLVEASLFGFQYEPVKGLIFEGIRFLNYMSGKYLALKEPCEIAISRLKNLLLPSAASLEEYQANPQGPISEVIQKELSCGVSPFELLAKIESYQLNMAAAFLRLKVKNLTLSSL